MCLKLNSDAIFIADSHFSSKAQGLVEYLNTLLLSPPSQLFLMGDIAQVLVGNLSSSIKSHQNLLETLNQLEKSGVQIIWLEGNHDFFLSHLPSFGYLQKTLFIPRKKQPLIINYKDKRYLLAHGDLFLGLKYELYIKTLTNIPYLLKSIDYLSGGEIYSELEATLEEKPIRQHTFYFFEFASKRIKYYQHFMRNKASFSGIIEGHFHIGKKIDICGISYISLPSFYFTTQGIETIKLLK